MFLMGWGIRHAIKMLYGGLAKGVGWYQLRLNYLHCSALSVCNCGDGQGALALPETSHGIVNPLGQLES